ncbi:contractile injection system protein, VgrG/Pvc8 family [Clostridium sp.]|uniref:contractile injection system protein, VgrG/Pvc8 family n=2 Tax=unclassified Clostridium TaxID=2614128 RepID=UPI00289EE9B4|nr:AHH domain-containing protein [Clostridium sp.]
MGVLHALRVKSPYKLLRIEDIKIDNKPNEHGYLYLKCLIDDSIKFQSAINASSSDKICVYEELEDENLRESSININVVNENKSKILFNGMISSIKTTNNNGVYYLEIEGITSSFELDIKEKSRSFQNANMTYEELIGTILKDYSGYSYTQCISKGRKIGKPLFQYKETDWSFLKRIASELNSELFCDIMETRNMFYFGRPIKASYEIEDKGFYKACKDLKRFHEVGGLEAGHDTDYFYYEIKRREKYEVGDKIRFKNKDFYVNQYSAYALKDEVIYKYRLCRKNGIWQTKMYNSLLSGGSLEGKVLAVEGEKVKLNLDIDKGQSKEAAWFSYAPPTGNTMYSMPVVGTSAALYFPNESSEAPIVTGCVRKNGGSCAKTSDTTKRYFGTEHGSEIEMTPGALNINGGSKEPLNISFDDNTGVTLKSPKKLSLNADGEILIKTPQNINIKAESQIFVAKAGTQSGFSVENEFHFLGDTVIEDARDRETYPPFDDEPKAAQKPEEKPQKKEEKKQEEKKEEKKKFSWGKLAIGVIAGLAVVAVVTVAAVAIAGAVATAAVATAVGAGAAIAGTAAVASQAISDKRSGEVSDASAYMWAGGRESFIGALSTAVFGPFGTGKKLCGKMLLGGITNGFESIVRQTMDGKGISIGTVLSDMGIGIVTAGIFHGAGKLFKKASPFVKNAFNKVSSKISENIKVAKIALNNTIKRPVKVLGCGLGAADEALGAFTKEFKKVKNAIKSGSNPTADELSKFDFGRYLKKAKGLPPSGMQNPHAHHIAVKGKFSNRKKIVQAYANYSRQVLKEAGIDPYFGLENIHWAPNKGHSNKYIKAVAKELYGVKSAGGTKVDFERKLLEIAEQLRKGKFPPR